MHAISSSFRFDYYTHLRTENRLTKTRHRTRGMGWAERNILQEYFMLLCGVLPPLSSRSSQTKIGLLFCLSMRRRFCLRKCLKLNRRELLSGGDPDIEVKLFSMN